MDVCRCGAELGTEGGPQQDARREAPAPRGPAASSLVSSAVVAIAAIGGMAFGAYWFNRPSPPARPVETPAMVEPATIGPVVLGPPGQPASTAPAAPAVVSDRVPALPAAPALPAPPAVPAPPALEDVLTRVMPAVVLVEASGSRGSGFFVAPDTLLTNVHVVGSSSSVTIRRMNGETMPARVAQTAPQVDIAVLKLATADRAQTVLTLGSAFDARVGQEVVAIGSALGLLQNTVTRGIVSAVRQTGDATLVQTDAAVNPGNSGGPLLDRAGRVLGITTMGFSGRQGLNFAVAIDHARALLEGKPPSAPQTSSSPATAEMRSLSPSRPSEIEQARTAGMRLYEQAMGQLARRADTLENSWRQFRASCYEGRVARGFDREWFAVFDERAMQGAVSPGCGGWFADFRRQAAEVRDGVIAAEEAARRADVYPGFRRDARRRHRLDYPGWDR